MSGTVTYATVTAGLCLMMASWSSGDDEMAMVVITGDGGGPRSRRFVIVNGEDVPDYDDYDDPGHDTGGGGGGGGHDYDNWYPDLGDDDDDDDEHHHHHHDDDDDDDDDDFDFGHYGPDFHHVWWHHFYHHGEPHLPFPLFPPFFVHRLRPVHRRRRGCAEWPFVCRNAYEVVQWLQCYHEFLGGSLTVDKFHHGVPVVPVHAWKKK